MDGLGLARHLLLDLIRVRVAQALRKQADLILRKPHRLAHLPQRRAAAKRREHAHTRHMLRAVTLLHPAHQFVPPFPREVNVNVRHLRALEGHEALEAKVAPDRVNIGNPQAVPHRAVHDRPPAGCADPARFRLPNQVPDHQKVAFAVQMPDHHQFVIESRFDLARHAAPAALRPLKRELAQELPRPSGADEWGGDIRARYVERIIVAHRGDPAGRGDRFGVVPEAEAELVRRQQILLGVQRTLRARLVHFCERAHAGENVVRGKVGAVQVMDVICGGEGNAQVRGYSGKRVDEVVLVGKQQALNLDEEALPENPAVPECGRAGGVVAPRQNKA